MTVHRQRLNVWGWIGALLFVCGPVAIAWQIVEVLTYPGYSEPDMTGLFIASFAPALGLVLLLIGREYYDATEAAVKEAAQAQAYYERNR